MIEQIKLTKEEAIEQLGWEYCIMLPIDFSDVEVEENEI